MSSAFRGETAVLCAALVAPGDWMVRAHAEPAPAAAESPSPAAADPAPKIPADQLDSLVAPLALYPDPLLGQTLVASTYPLEIVQLDQWLEKNKSLKGDALEEAVKKQGWDPSIQAMAAIPDVVKRLADDIKWTTDLGNAFLSQQSDVMDAVQRMRKKAMDAGNLKSTEQQKVETRVVETQSVIVIEPADPQVVYVPVYTPSVVYGPPVYPYPPIYYPPPSYYAGGVLISFGIGVAMGAAIHGGWGYGCGWGHNDININVNNNYVSHYNKQNVNAPNGPGNTSWKHNPQHRGGAPYSNPTVANKYGGAARGDSPASRPAGAPGGKPQAGTMDRGAGGKPQTGTMDRGAGGKPQAGTMDRGTGGLSSQSPQGGGGDRIGNHQVPSTSSSRTSSAFGDASKGVSGSSARASSARGASSMGASRSGGGGARGGGRRR